MNEKRCKGCYWWRIILRYWNGDNKPLYIPKDRRDCDRFPEKVEKYDTDVCGEWRSL